MEKGARKLHLEQRRRRKKNYALEFTVNTVKLKKETTHNGGQELMFKMAED